MRKNNARLPGFTFFSAVAMTAVILFSWSNGTSVMVAHASGEIASPVAEFPAFSPDRSKLVFASDIGGSRDLWVSDADGSNAFLLTPWPDSNERHPDWSPDGSQIVFSSNRNSSSHNIWVIDPASLEAQQVSDTDAEYEYPRFSPNGSSILFLSNETGKKEMWIMATDGSAAQPVALISMFVSDPSWSPTGEQIVYVGCRRGGACNLFRINRDGSNPFQITNGDHHDWHPDWGTMGILFSSNVGNVRGLWLIQPDGSGLQQITAPSGVADLDPRWTDESGAFVFNRSGKTVQDAASDIWIGSLGTEPERITKLLAGITVSLDMPDARSCRSPGLLPVSVLSDSDFDATFIEADSVRFGKTGTEAAVFHRDQAGSAVGHVEDVNDNGILDVVFHFEFAKTGFDCSDIPAGARRIELPAILTGETQDGTSFVGENLIRILK